ncbi:MAG: hypothetical protein ACOC5K_04335 [Chloroflexota bacterium]
MESSAKLGRVGKRRWLAAVTVGVVSAGLMAGATLANENSDPESDQPSALDRVAETLGIERSALDDAFAQAREGVMAERMDTVLGELVEAGEISEDEAEAVRDWLEARPVGLDRLTNGVPGSVLHAYGLGLASAGDRLAGKLDDLVEEGIVTEDEADAILTWIDDKPNAVEEAIRELAPGQADRGNPHFHPEHGPKLRGGPGLGPGFGHGKSHSAVPDDREQED